MTHRKRQEEERIEEKKEKEDIEERKEQDLFNKDKDSPRNRSKRSSSFTSPKMERASKDPEPEGRTRSSSYGSESKEPFKRHRRRRSGSSRSRSALSRSRGTRSSLILTEDRKRIVIDDVDFELGGDVTQVPEAVLSPVGSETEEDAEDVTNPKEEQKEIGMSKPVERRGMSVATARRLAQMKRVHSLGKVSQATQAKVTATKHFFAEFYNSSQFYLSERQRR